VGSIVEVPSVFGPSVDITATVVVASVGEADLVVASVVVVSTAVTTSAEAETIVELSAEDSEAKPELVVSNAIEVVDAIVEAPDAEPDLVSLFSSTSNEELTQRPGLTNTCVCGPEASKAERYRVKNAGTHGNPM
jgi:hypothetical protein